MPRACKRGKVPINSETGVHREKALILGGREIPPGNWSHPVASEAAAEATKLLKPSVEKVA